MKLVLAGNPNSGKTSIFNMLTGANQKVGNYGGVTVDFRLGKVKHGNEMVEVVDLPGTYSLTAYSIEEMVARDYIVNEKPDVVVNVLDSTNLERNLYLTAQLLELEAPLLLVFNMSDEADQKGIKIDYEQLSKLLWAPYVKTVGRTGTGVKNILKAAGDLLSDPKMKIPRRGVKYTGQLEHEINIIEQIISLGFHPEKYGHRWLAVKLLEGDSEVEKFMYSYPEGMELKKQIDKSRDKISGISGIEADTLIAEARYGFVKGAVKETVLPKQIDRVELSDKIDNVLTHKLLAFPIFLSFMWLIFQLTFSIGQYPMDWLEGLVAWLSALAESSMAPGNLRDLIVNGIIGGVGGVIVFLPNILILFFGLSFMEDTGYMARAAFIMDKLMHVMGLHGKSFIPMVMGFGCNVPAILATRTLESRTDRMLTILLAPLISCSARLPVYILFAGAFFPNYAGTVVFSMYVLGIILAFGLGKIFRKILFKGEEYPFVMELPPYRLPTMRSVAIHMWEKAKHYLKKMGGVVLVFSILLWFLGAFPKDQNIIDKYVSLAAGTETSTELNIEEKSIRLKQLANEKDMDLLRNSYIGKLGMFIEPAIRPLGFEWKAGVSLITGFVAKEIVVSSMGVLYNAGSGEDETSEGLRANLKGSFTPLSAYAFMVFVLLYTPCIVALVTVIKEIKSWKFSLFSVAYQLALAWGMAFIVYQGGRLIGFE